MRHFFLFLFTLAFLVSCVEEEDVFETPFQPISVEGASNNLASFFVNTNGCFEFNYPITIESNKEELITVSNRISLNRVLESQSLNFFITKIQLPFSVTNTDSELIEVNSEIDFIELSNQCAVPTLKKRVAEELENESCLDIEYPVFTLSQSKETNTFRSRIDFIGYLSNQENSFVLNFEYPLSIIEASKSRTLINNDFEMHTFLKNCSTPIDSRPIDQACENLPELVISEEILPDVARFEVDAGQSNLSEISWFIDDRLVNKDRPTFSLQFNPLADGPQKITVTAKIDDCDTLFETSIIVDVSQPQEEEEEEVLEDTNTLTTPNDDENTVVDSNSTGSRGCNFLIFEDITTDDDRQNMLFRFSVPEDLLPMFSGYRWDINDQVIPDENNSTIVLDSNNELLTGMRMTTEFFILTLSAKNELCPLEEKYRIDIVLP